MKTNFFFFLLISLSWTSCVPHYQIYQLTSEQVEMIDEDVYLHEENAIAVTYDFWTEGGIALFEVYNHGDSVMYLDLKESQFVVNGFSFSYFDDNLRIGQERREENQGKVLWIEAQQSRVIEGFPVTYDWQRIPKNRNPVIFGEGDSPLKIENKLVYSYDAELKNKKILNNEFWITEINQLKSSDFRAYKSTELNKSNKFYVTKRSNPNSDYFWLDIVFTILQVAISF